MIRESTAVWNGKQLVVKGTPVKRVVEWNGERLVVKHVKQNGTKIIEEECCND